MRVGSRLWSPPWWVGAALLSVGLVGCNRVRQDRGMVFSEDGESVGFQNNEEGIFVTEEEGGPPVKVFQPNPDVLVSSTPLWAPADRRLIFTTARAREEAADQRPPRREAPPEGEVYRERPVTYTCYLREAPRDGKAAEPKPLFDAACDHPGYVAAKLAVRWHPRGDRILYINETAPHEHTLFEYNLTTGASRRIFPQFAQALAFDWAPDGRHLACVLGSKQANAPDSGIWVGKPGEDRWWQVPGSEALAGSARAPLERVRATRPVWSPDGRQFAFLTHTPGTIDRDPGRFVLRLATLAGREVRVLIESASPLRDVHWKPDGTRLGLVRDASLRLVGLDGRLSDGVSERPVGRFAGWNARGDRLAYTAPEGAKLRGGESWAFLLAFDPRARDAVYVADGSGEGPGREVFSGMRVTFPRWSPKKDRLSLWLTFAPSYRSVPARLIGLGMPAGDPAAMLDLKTGRVNWMAVNGREKAQIGHYHLLKQDYATAWEWYQKAEAAQPARKEKPTAEQRLQDLFAGRDVSLFEYHCLTQLGRAKEAAEKLAHFRQAFAALGEAQSRESRRPETGAAGRSNRDIDRLDASLLRDLYAAEVFLALDAAADGERYFKSALETAPTDNERLSSAVVLGQLLLLGKKHAEYAELATKTIWPLLARSSRSGQEVALPRAGNDFDPRALLWGGALLPMYAPEFVASLPADQVRALVPRWLDLRAGTTDEVFRLTADLFLEAAHKKLAQQQERQEVAGRIAASPARQKYLPNGIGGLVEQIRQLPTQLDALADLLAGT